MDDVAKTPVVASAGARRLPGIRDLFPVLLLAALCVIFALLSDRFLTVGNGLIVLQQSTVLLVAALAMTFVIVNGSIDLSVGSTVALSALLTKDTSGEVGLAPLLGWIGLLPCVAGLITVVRLWRRA